MAISSGFGNDKRCIAGFAGLPFEFPGLVVCSGQACGFDGFDRAGWRGYSHAGIVPSGNIFFNAGRPDGREFILLADTATGFIRGRYCFLFWNGLLISFQVFYLQCICSAGFLDTSKSKSATEAAIPDGIV